VFALLRPRHLGRLVTADPAQQAAYDALAQTYGARDLAVSALALVGRSDRRITTAVLLRIVFDVTDGLVLAPKAGRQSDSTARDKVLGVTFGWATLNAVALMVDRRRR
jgi:hypothetical protein